MSEIINFDVTEKGNELSVILTEQTFADIILNFLGKKEKLKYSITETSFLMRQNDIEQFYYLLNAKISKEQNVSIDHFLVTINYSDGTSREISGIKSLNTFIETRDVIPIDVTMSWNIIIKYPKAETIENQKIELAFIKNGFDDEGTIILDIYHTNQSWGIEVLNLFKDKIAELVIKQSKGYKNIKSLKSFFNIQGYFIVFTLLIFTIMLFSLSQPIFKEKGGVNYYRLASFYSKNQAFIEKELALFSVTNLNNDYLRMSANNAITNPELKTIMLDIADYKDLKEERMKKKLIILFLSTPIILIFIHFYIKKALSFYRTESFILISRRSQSEYDQYINSKNRNEFYSITLLFISSMCGVLGNFIYQIITSF